MDVCIEYPSVLAHSLDGFVTGDRFWRIERISGPEPALEAIETVRFDGTSCGESITDHDCEAARYHDVLERDEGELVLYTYLEDITRCESIHTLAGKHLPSGLVFETRREGSRHHWRVLMRSDANVGVLYDEIGARLRDGLTFRMGHLRDADGWRRDAFATLSMPDEQRTALEAAVAGGYYETPRETTLDAIADDLSIPRSTLSYRLRRAEATLARRFVGEGGDRWLR